MGHRRAFTRNILILTASASLVSLACSKDDEQDEGATAGGAATGGSSTGGGSSGGSGTGGGGTGRALAGGGGATGGGGQPATGGVAGGDPGVGGATGGAIGGETTGGAVTGGEGPGGAAGATGMGGTGPVTVAPPSCEEPPWDPADFSAVFEVGPGQEYETPSDVPWESIGPGTLVRIHRRDAPYADKWVIAVEATADAPVVVLGVPEGGLLPEITGEGAFTRHELDYWSETRGIIKIGGSSAPDVETASHVVVECLDLSGARADHEFTDEGGSTTSYDDNASAIFVEAGASVTLRNNLFHDCGNGLFVASQSSDVLVSGNQLWDNGNPDSIYEHNSYTEARGIVFEFNRYGELCAGCGGNNLKDRSSGLVVRYNTIVGGNRALDLVDSTYDTISGASDYDDSFVYGNVLVELDDGGNRQIVHYGGDEDEAYFRTGTLHFYHNTVVSERSGLAILVRLSSAEATLDARNNVLYATAGGDSFGILEESGTASLQGNWLPAGWRDGSPSLAGTVTASDNHEGIDPGFADVGGRDYALTPGAEADGITVSLADATAAYPVEHEYRAPAGGAARARTESAGAFELE
ncbi:MAG: right-handed parallel beta-helix repeat-containing protein [Polyangiaceae bacterium]|nr:right-handed parallel beta-helix repeat-containing protein [Polyangiaceae bacterium]